MVELQSFFKSVFVCPSTRWNKRNTKNSHPTFTLAQPIQPHCKCYFKWKTWAYEHVKTCNRSCDMFHFDSFTRWIFFLVWFAWKCKYTLLTRRQHSAPAITISFHVDQHIHTPNWCIHKIYAIKSTSFCLHIHRIYGFVLFERDPHTFEAFQLLVRIKWKNWLAFQLNHMTFHKIKSSLHHSNDKFFFLRGNFASFLFDSWDKTDSIQLDRWPYHWTFCYHEHVQPMFLVVVAHNIR